MPGRKQREKHSGSHISMFGLKQDLWNVSLRVRNETMKFWVTCTWYFDWKNGHPLFPWVNSQDSPLDFLSCEVILFWIRKHNKTINMLDIKYFIVKILCCIALLDGWTKNSGWTKPLFWYDFFFLEGVVFFVFLGACWVFVGFGGGFEC